MDDYQVPEKLVEGRPKIETRKIYDDNIGEKLKTMISLNTVILLWTLYYTKHRNWFHESLVMLEIFTKLPLII